MVTYFPGNGKGLGWGVGVGGVLGGFRDKMDYLHGNRGARRPFRRKGQATFDFVLLILSQPRRQISRIQTTETGRH